LALEGLSPAKQNELLGLVGSVTFERLARVRELYDEAGVFEKANRLIDKHRERAEKIADEIRPEELRALLYYLVDSVLDHAEPAPPLVLSSID
jgi:geranylgeranyl pyrophosphate synthase